jgi:hypothetical protein
MQPNQKINSKKMKKFTIILTVLIALTIKTNAQIPDAGFENWFTIHNCLEPESWHSLYQLIDSSGSYCPITRSTDHYPAFIGSYSVVIANDTALYNSGTPPANFLGWGILMTTHLNDEPLFPVTGHPKSLCGYYKFLPQNGDTMNINLHLYYQGIEIAHGTFQSDIAASVWTSFKFFVNDTLYSNVDSAKITLCSANEPKNGHGRPHGNSILYIDNLSFDTLTGITTSAPELSTKNTLFNLFPNPTSDNVTLNINNENNEYFEVNIYGIMGELISKELLQQKQQQMNTGNLSNGIYIVEIKSGEWTEKQKLIIQR